MKIIAEGLELSGFMSYTTIFMWAMFFILGIGFILVTAFQASTWILRRLLLYFEIYADFLAFAKVRILSRLDKKRSQKDDQ